MGSVELARLPPGSWSNSAFLRLMWGSRGALVTTDTKGNQLDLPPEVRASMITGAPHFSAPGARTVVSPTCELPVSPVHAGAASRALMAALERWVSDGIEPPASRYPMRSNGTLAPAEHLYPEIPGLPYRGLYNPAQWDRAGRISARHPRRMTYVGAVKASADHLVAERLLRPEDAAEMVEAAAAGQLVK